MTYLSLNIFHHEPHYELHQSVIHTSLLSCAIISNKKGKLRNVISLSLMFLSSTTSVLHQTVDHFSTQPPLFNRLWTHPTQPWTTTRARAILLHFSKMFLVFMETFSPRLQPPIVKVPFQSTNVGKRLST